MRLHTQTLGKESESILRHRRAWIGRRFHSEWQFLSRHIGFSATINFGSGDNDDGVTLHLAIPFLLSVFLVVSGVRRLRKEVHTGIAIHNGAIWFYPLPYTMESNSIDPWWRKTYCWNFPWTLDWYSTELLENKAFLPYHQGTVLREERGDRRNGIDSWNAKDRMAETVSEEHDYTYVLKSGKVQHVRAKIHVERMTWRARWWPFIPREKSVTSIDVRFSGEVGERAGSWKGGCTGCGYEMRLGETPWETLKRMERERKFN